MKPVDEQAARHPSSLIPIDQSGDADDPANSTLVCRLRRNGQKLVAEKDPFAVWLRPQISPRTNFDRGIRSTSTAVVSQPSYYLSPTDLLLLRPSSLSHLPLPRPISIPLHSVPSSRSRYPSPPQLPSL
nr:hypothetical protein CFP56_66142 [Quercus suber]